MLRTPNRALLAALAILLATSCGSDEEPSAEGGAATVLEVAADPGGGLRFDREELTAGAGRVTIEMANPSAVPHAVGIKSDGLDVKGETVGKDGVSTVSAELEPGVYGFYCPVGSHEAAGMRGELQVE
jgi:plastocyanin